MTILQPKSQLFWRQFAVPKKNKSLLKSPCKTSEKLHNKNKEQGTRKIHLIKSYIDERRKEFSLESVFFPSSRMINGAITTTANLLFFLSSFREFQFKRFPILSIFSRSIILFYESWDKLTISKERYCLTTM